IELLKDKDWEVRSQAAQGLRYIGPEAKPAVPALIELFQDRHLCDTAVDSIEAIGPAAGPDFIKSLRPPKTLNRVFYRRALFKVDPHQEAGVRTLISSLRDSEAEVRSQAAWGLLRMEKRAVPAVAPLTGALQDEDREVRENSARALCSIGPQAKEAIPALIQ